MRLECEYKDIVIVNVNSLFNFKHCEHCDQIFWEFG